MIKGRFIIFLLFSALCVSCVGGKAISAINNDKQDVVVVQKIRFSNRYKRQIILKMEECIMPKEDVFLYQIFSFKGASGEGIYRISKSPAFPFSASSLFIVIIDGYIELFVPGKEGNKIPDTPHMDSELYVVENNSTPRIIINRLLEKDAKLNSQIESIFDTVKRR